MVFVIALLQPLATPSPASFKILIKIIQLTRFSFSQTLKIISHYYHY